MSMRSELESDKLQLVIASGPIAYLRRRWKFLTWTLVLLAVIVVFGLVTHDAIEDSLQDVLAKNLNAVLDADIEALTIWMENEKKDVQLWARIVANEISGFLPIVTSSSAPRAALLATEEQETLNNLFRADLDGEEKERGYLVMDLTGIILASNESALVGRRINAQGMAVLGQVMEHGVWITHPFPEGSLITDAPVRRDVPRMLAVAQVTDQEGAALAVLAFVIDPQLDFTRILSVARIGDTGNTYAFDRSGVLLSDSRFEQQLQEIGLLPSDSVPQSILNVEIRDPGGDLSEGYKPEIARSEQPLTRMAASAVTGKNGIDIRGYRDFRGVKVVGTWRWLPEYDLGVATEVSLAEVLRVIRPLTIAYWVLFALLLILALTALIANRIIRRLHGRIGENQQVDRYTLEKKLGEGGSGEVYRARHHLLRRPTAIKLLKGDSASPDMLARFEREVQLTSQLTHPNTIEIYDYGYTAEGIFYYVMQYLHGITLAKLIEIEGAVAPERAIHILRQVCASLQEAHSIGLIHRDIKPLNIVLCEMGGEPDFVKVLDFGLVREISLPEDQAITATQVINGTPLYIAPERLIDPNNVDARSDIYSLGVVGYNLLTGKDLYEGANALELSHHSLHSPIPHPADNSANKIPPALDQLIMDCLAKDPDTRPSSAREIIDRLEDIDLEHPWDWERARQWWEEHAAVLEQWSLDGPLIETPPSMDSRTLAINRDNQSKGQR